jgi:exopolysaccharide biosynthesis protein
MLTLSPQKFDVKFVKAHNQVFGRETIDSIAKRSGADIAINAGFFEIGNNNDGMPSATLIIDNQMFGLGLNKQACLLYDKKKFWIEEVTPRIEVVIGKKNFVPHHVNKFSGSNDIVLYNRLWGSHTLTPLFERNEITIDKQNNIRSISKHGNCAIPKYGFVLSLPRGCSTSGIALKSKVILRKTPAVLFSTGNISAITGIPMLLKDKQLNPLLTEKSSSFYQLPHARTAVGIKRNGDLVIVVAEHLCPKQYKNITLEDIKNIFDHRKMLNKSLNDHRFLEIKEIVMREFSDKATIVGLTLSELALLLKSLGCDSAINLDGGGSSSLWNKGKIVNLTMGDDDEKSGHKIARPLSDAIIFRKKQ